jgi:alkaline phosphatase D
MLVEVATSDSFRGIRSAAFVDALPETDFTAKALIENLPAGQDVFYRIRFQDHSFPAVFGAPQVGRFRTAPSGRRSVSFVWSGDTAGQGWGIDEARGGMRTYAAMLKCRPDFFVHSGDHIYADCPIRAEQKLPDGEVWKNVVTEDKSKVAQTLAEFRGNYKYNLLDRNLLAFNAEVRWPKPGASIARSPMVPCSTSSSSTCAPTARATARTAPPRRSSERRSSPGSSAS